MPEAVSVPVAFMAGALAGYAARCAEESAAWAEEAAPRVMVDGQFFSRPTAAELREAREDILREAHNSGLHAHRPLACPVCQS